jgi:peptidoglycan hydrolase CwlO-like protein
MTIEITIVISAVSVAYAIYFGLKSNRRNDIKDIEERAANNAKVNMKLDNISVAVNDIKYDISATKKEVKELTERVVSVEQSAKSAHHRLDDYLGTIDRKEKTDAE